MGPIARVLWECLPELLHVGAVLVVVALILAVMGTALFGDRAAFFSTFSGLLLYGHLVCTHLSHEQRLEAPLSSAGFQPRETVS